MKKLSSLLLLTCILFGCKKGTITPAPDPVTVPVSFTGTTYNTLGTYDSNGKPNYLVTPDVISSGLKTYLGSILIDQVDLTKTHPELFSSTAIADIALTKRSEVDITYVYQLTSQGDAIGFYTYPTNNPPATAADIKTITYVFPDAGGTTTLNAGDKVNIGTFDPGTSIGFVLIVNAWKNGLDNTAVHFCSNDALNPEVSTSLKKHAVLINYAPESKVLIGFEDSNRTAPYCDNDFNDVVIYATTTAK